MVCLGELSAANALMFEQLGWAFLNKGGGATPDNYKAEQNFESKRKYGSSPEKQMIIFFPCHKLSIHISTSNITKKLIRKCQENMS